MLHHEFLAVQNAKDERRERRPREMHKVGLANEPAQVLKPRRAHDSKRLCVILRPGALLLGYKRNVDRFVACAARMPGEPASQRQHDGLCSAGLRIEEVRVDQQLHASSRFSARRYWRATVSHAKYFRSTSIFFSCIRRASASFVSTLANAAPSFA